MVDKTLDKDLDVKEAEKLKSEIDIMSKQEESQDWKEKG